MTPTTTHHTLQKQSYSTIPLSDTEFPFDITTILSPFLFPVILIKILLRNFKKPQFRKQISIPASIEERRRRSQVYPSLPLPLPCIHSQHGYSLLHPIPALESLIPSVKNLR